jgi:beta-glucanase (GH16 family)
MHERAAGRRRLWAAALAAAMLGGCVSAGTGPSATPGDQPTAAAPSASPSPSPTAQPTAGPPGPAFDPATWTLVWSDEFDGPAGSPPDPEHWLHDIGGGGWGNKERQFYTDYPENASLDGAGSLLIRILPGDGSFACHYGPCDYTSARLVTRGRFEVRYGHIEARIRVPGGYGTWPAFWMLGSDIGTAGWPGCGEIDVMEYVGRRPDEILGTLHGPGYSGSGGHSTRVDVGAPVADDFHVFAVDWRPGRITWSLDGVPYQTVTPADVAPYAWVFDQPFTLLLNVAVGGGLGGLVPPGSSFPDPMAVDYVRVYQEPAP